MKVSIVAISDGSSAIQVGDTTWTFDAESISVADVSSILEALSIPHTYEFKKDPAK